MRFEYVEPESIDQAISALRKYGNKARVIAGGTDLVPKLRTKAVVLDYVIDISSLPGLNYIRYDDKQGLSIGALTPIRVLETSAELRQRYPVIAYAASQLGSVAVRNIATIGGNLCNAVPSAEMPPSLVALSARARIVGPDGERVVPVENLFTGVCATCLKNDEMLVEIQVPKPSPETRCAYFKHSVRGTIDLAIVNIAVALTAKNGVCQDVKLVLGAVASTPMRAHKAEAILKGNKLEESLIAKAARAASEEAKPITDQRATAEYRRAMVKVFTERLIRQAMSAQA